MHAVTEITINNGASISSLENEKLSILLDILLYKNKQN